MYLEHFNISRFPFPNAMDPENFFEDSKRGVTLKALEYATLHEEGLTTVVGNIGVGKSTMLCLLVKTISPFVETVVVDDPRITPSELLEIVAEQLKVKIEPGQTIRKIRPQLVLRLEQLQLLQRRVVVVIDEAQYLSTEVLEEIHILSNLENNEKKMLQWVLFGQMQMENYFTGKAASPLRDRIINRICLAPLGLQEVDRYLKFRMEVAGFSAGHPFSWPSVELIAKISGGYLRKIHLLAHKALMAAYAEGADEVQSYHVQVANQENEDIKHAIPYHDDEIVPIAKGIGKEAPISPPPAAARGRQPTIVAGNHGLFNGRRWLQVAAAAVATVVVGVGSLILLQEKLATPVAQPKAAQIAPAEKEVVPVVKYNNISQPPAKVVVSNSRMVQAVPKVESYLVDVQPQQAVVSVVTEQPQLPASAIIVKPQLTEVLPLVTGGLLLAPAMSEPIQLKKIVTFLQYPHEDQYAPGTFIDDVAQQNIGVGNGQPVSHIVGRGMMIFPNKKGAI